MPRNYRYIKEYEKEILKLKEEGFTKREIGDKLGQFTASGWFFLVCKRTARAPIEEIFPEKFLQTNIGFPMETRCWSTA